MSASSSNPSRDADPSDSSDADAGKPSDSGPTAPGASDADRGSTGGASGGGRGGGSDDDAIRIFISSPGDVAQERVIAERVAERLQGEFARRATLEVVRWEREPLRSTEHFQEQITPPAETDIALFILWSRLGTPLPEDKFQKDSGEPYRSGTEWEFENAVEGYQESGTPDLLTYRKTKDPEATLEDEEEIQQRIEQKQALDAFIDRWFKGEEGDSFRAAFHTFEEPADFEQMLEEHLRKLIEKHLPERPTEAGSAAPRVEAEWHQGSPFRGLRPFEAEHAPVFFGRTGEVTGIIQRLEDRAEEGRPFVLVHGPSGSGKSSVVKAGVVPTLTRPGVIEGVGLWRTAQFRPGKESADPIESLTRSLFRSLPELEATGFTQAELAGLLRKTPGQAENPLQAGLRNAAEAEAEQEGLPEPPEARMLLVVDQLEEVFTLGGVSASEREQFADAVQALVESGLVWTVATMRSDFFPRLSGTEGLQGLKQGAGNYDLDPPSLAQLGLMIRGPVRAAGLRFEEDPDRGIGLDEVLQEAAAEAPEALPLLEFTLEELYRRRTEEDVLTFEAYEELGGLEGAIAERAEAVFQDQPAEARAAFEAVMQKLVTVDSGGDGEATARRARWAEVAGTAGAEALAEALVEARLLVTDRSSSGERVVEVAHEALLREWPRLREWIDRSRAFLQARARVRERARRWDQDGRPKDLLLPSGQPLAEGRGLLEERGEALSSLLRTYVERSVERAERRKRRRRRVASGVLAAFIAVVAGFGLFSYQQWTTVSEQRDEILAVLEGRSRRLADAAEKQTRKGDPMTGMLLALEALPADMSNRDRPYVSEAHSALYDALVHNHEIAFFDGHSGLLMDAALGPEERYLVTGSADSTARLYNLSQKRLCAVLRGHEEAVRYLSFSEDGDRVATASRESVVVWNLPTGEKLWQIDLGAENDVTDIKLGPRGRKVATATKFGLPAPRRGYAGHRITVWAKDKSKLYQTELAGITDDMAFGPAGRRIGVAFERVPKQGPQAMPSDRPHIVRLLSGLSREGDLESDALRGEVDQIRFLEDGNRIAAYSVRPDQGRTVEIEATTWLTSDMTRRGKSKIEVRLTEESGAGSPIASLKQGPDSALGETFSEMSFSITTPTLGFRNRTTFRLDAGLRGVTVGQKSQIRVQTADSVRDRVVWEKQRFEAMAGWPLLVRRIPSRGKIVGVGKEGVQLWTMGEVGNNDSPSRTAETINPTTPVASGHDVVLSPDQTHFAFLGREGGLHLLAMAEGQGAEGKAYQHHVFHDYGGTIYDIGFSRGSEGSARLVAGTSSGNLHVWDVDGGTHFKTVSHEAPVHRVGFASNGERIVSVTGPMDEEGSLRRQGKITLWNIESGETLVQIDSLQWNNRLFSKERYPFRITSDGSRFLVAKDGATQADDDSQVRDADPVIVEVRDSETGDLLEQYGRGARLSGFVGSERAAGVGPQGRYLLMKTTGEQPRTAVVDLPRTPEGEGGLLGSIPVKPRTAVFAPSGEVLAALGPVGAPSKSQGIETYRLPDLTQQSALREVVIGTDTLRHIAASLRIMLGGQVPSDRLSEERAIARRAVSEADTSRSVASTLGLALTNEREYGRLPLSRDRSRLRFHPSRQGIAGALRPPVFWHHPESAQNHQTTNVLKIPGGGLGAAKGIRFSPGGNRLLILGNKSVYGFRGDPKDRETFMKQTMALRCLNASGETEAIEHAQVVGERKVLTQTSAGTLHLWPIFKSPQALIDSAQKATTRSLRPSQRERFGISSNR
jgi:WD40 repeat protein